MTRVANIYDGLVSLCTTYLTNYVQLPDAYVLEDNNQLFLKRAFAVTFGSALNSERFVNCNRASILRNYDIILINQVTTTENNTTQRVALEKALMEDVFTLIKRVELDPDLSTLATKIKYVNDTGIEYLESNVQKYLLTVLTFEAEYIESI